jgi:phosphate transport system permease protein
MALSLLLLIVAIIGVAAFVLCRQRVLSQVSGNVRSLHSLPNYYGWHGFVMAVVPAILVLATWLIVQPLLVERQLVKFIPVEMQEDPAARTLFMADVRRVAGGLDTAIQAGAITAEQAVTMAPEDVRGALATARVALGSEVSTVVLDAAQDYRVFASTGALWRSLLTIALSLAGAAYAVMVTAPQFRARNRVELVVQGLLILASTIAILTTVGIVMSMLSESIRFFTLYPIRDFFFGLTWSPNFRGNSELGLIPLLWGTLYISLVAMIVAVPTGIFTAIYLAEYASPRVRAIVKPLIEVIAGIPTVVFGLFALVTVGPLLRDWFAVPFGLGNSGSSVMTAGLVIGR